MMQSTSDLSIQGIAPLTEELGNVLRWLEIAPRSRLAQTLLLATLQSWAEAVWGELSPTRVPGDTVCPPRPPAQGSLETAAGSRCGQVRKKTLPGKPDLSLVRVGCWKNTRSLFSMKRKKVQPDKADFFKGWGWGVKNERAVYSPLCFPLHQKEGEGERREGVGGERERETISFYFLLNKGKILTGKITSIFLLN